MTPLEYDCSLKERSGLVLSADKQYLVESRLLPIARKAGLASLSELVATLRRSDSEGLMTAVVEAMTTNETFFFRDKVPFENFRTAICRRYSQPDESSARSASGRLPPRPVRNPIRWP